MTDLLITLAVNSLSGDGKMVNVSAADALGNTARFSCEAEYAPRCGDYVSVSFEIVPRPADVLTADSRLIPGAVELPTLADAPAGVEIP